MCNDHSVDEIMKVFTTFCKEGTPDSLPEGSVDLTVQMCRDMEVMVEHVASSFDADGVPIDSAKGGVEQENWTRRIIVLNGLGEGKGMDKRPKENETTEEDLKKKEEELKKMQAVKDRDARVVARESKKEEWETPAESGEKKRKRRRVEEETDTEEEEEEEEDTETQAEAGKKKKGEFPLGKGVAEIHDVVDYFYDAKKKKVMATVDWVGDHPESDIPLEDVMFIDEDKRQAMKKLFKKRPAFFEKYATAIDDAGWPVPKYLLPVTTAKKSSPKRRK